MIKNYTEWLNETENVKLDKELREYTLTHVKNDRFQLKSKNFYKDFSVLPYKKELSSALQKVETKLSSAVESLDPQELYSAIKTAESIPYSFGNIYTSEYTLTQVPELSQSLDPDQMQDLNRSQKEFLANSFSSLGKTIRDEIIEQLRERAEVLCSVIEALFYYIRTVDRENFYEGMSRDEIIEDYEKEIEKASKESTFSFDGPFSEAEGRNELSSSSSVAFWICEKNTEKFVIRATVSPSDLYAEENLGGTKSLKFSIVTKENQTPEKDFSYFDIKELSNRVKNFYDKNLKK